MRISSANKSRTIKRFPISDNFLFRTDASLRKQLSHTYFALPSLKPNEQFYYFTSLVSFLMNLAGHNFPPPGQFDDPNVTCVNISESISPY